MQDLKLPDGVTALEMIVFILALIVAVSGLLVAIVKGVEAWKKISVRDRVKNLEGRMAKVEARLQLGDKRFELQNDDMGAMLATQQALLMHFITGNDHDKLRDELGSLNNYMNRRATRIIEYTTEQSNMMSGGQINGDG